MNKITDLQKDGDRTRDSNREDTIVSAGQRPRLRGKRLKLAAIVVVVLGAGALIAAMVAERWSTVFVDDSRIAANLITLSSQVSGRITSVPFIAGDHVAKGDLLASMDPSEALLALQVLDAQIAASDAQKQQLRAELELVSAGSTDAGAEQEQTALMRRIEALDAEKAALGAKREQTRIDLARHEIRADFDGVVDKTFISSGEYVSPGTRLLLYHDPNAVWVDANVKETDFGRLKVGAAARITVDAYPDVAFQGQVVRLGEATTSQFALLPSPNPSGNFTKVTQRLPVRVSIDQRHGLLRPGMMVELSIDAVD